MKKLKPWWTGVKIAGGFIAAATLGVSKIPDKTDPVSGATTPAILGIAQADWLMVSVLCGIVVALILAIDSIWAAAKERKLKKSARLERDLSRLALGLLKTISTTYPINLANLGASVFLYKEPDWRNKEFRLESILRYRLDDFPNRSGIEWKGPKGAIGHAAASKMTTYCNWVELSKELKQAKRPEPDILSEVPEANRFGLSETDLARMARNYYESLAIPIMSVHGNKLIGVLAVDIPNRSTLPDHQAMLGNEDVEEVAVTIAVGMATHLDPDYTAN